jgi:thiol-disulfide isomerase/thioredoxin
VPAGAAAIVDGVAITEEDMAKAAGPKWAQFKAQEYAFKRELIDGAIGQKLLENEAKKRGITVADLRQQEVESKTEAVSETQAKEFYEQNRQRFGTLSEAEALDQIQKGLFNQRLQRKLNEYVGDAQAAPPTCACCSSRTASRSTPPTTREGPADAAVTIVEFSDFQCPYCARIPPALKRVEETYGKNVRVVFRDFPLLSIHPTRPRRPRRAPAPPTRSKFWEMHDKVFANQQKMAVDDLKAYAKELGLDSAAFDACLDSGKKAEEWKADTADGEKYGVSGTPSCSSTAASSRARPGFEQMAPDHRRGAAAGRVLAGSAPTAPAGSRGRSRRRPRAAPGGPKN